MDWVKRTCLLVHLKLLTGKGMHYYYNNPEKTTLPLLQEELTTLPLKDLIDIRGVGGLIIAPGTDMQTDKYINLYLPGLEDL